MYYASPVDRPGLVVACGQSAGQVRRILTQRNLDPQDYRIYETKSEEQQ